MDDYIMFRVSKEFKDTLKKEAKEKRISLSSYIKIILAERKK